MCLGICRVAYCTILLCTKREWMFFTLGAQLGLNFGGHCSRWLAWNDHISFRQLWTQSQWWLAWGGFSLFLNLKQCWTRATKGDFIKKPETVGAIAKGQTQHKVIALLPVSGFLWLRKPARLRSPGSFKATLSSGLRTFPLEWTCKPVFSRL